MKYKTKVIVNPYSAFGKTYKKWKSIKEILSSIFKDMKCEFTDAPKHAVEITKESIRKGFEHILGVGGDGTFNEIVNGYLEKDKPLNEDAFISLFPSGKGNDFLRTIKHQNRIKRWKDLFLTDRKRTIDVGKIESKNGSSYFINVSSFGFSGEVVENIIELKKKIKYGFVYFLGALKTLRAFDSKRVRVRFDNGDELEDDVMIGAICNGMYFGGRMKVAPDAKLDDGFFDFLLLRKVSKAELLKKIIKIYKGAHIGDKEILIKRVKEVVIEPVNKDDKIPLEYDGELGKFLPVKFSLIPSVVKIKS